MAEQACVELEAEITEFTYHSDPGHGWMQVSAHLIKELGIEDKISRFSYVYMREVYLEEDCDASVFLSAWKEQGRGQVRFREELYDNRCYIRELLPYRTTLLW